MNKEASELENGSNRANLTEYHNTISHIVPNNVIVDMSGRSQLVWLKDIPPEQMIYVDFDGLSFSIPIRQFIFTISHGHAHETAIKYCPPAIRDMLIDLSKTKVVQDRELYRRAQLKMRLGQISFSLLFIFIIMMMLALIISATDAILKLKLSNRTFPYISIGPFLM